MLFAFEGRASHAGGITLDKRLKLCYDVFESDDMLNWSEPIRMKCDGEDFGGHYVGFYSDSDAGQPFAIEGDTLVVLRNGNGTDVTRCYARIEEI